MLTEDDLAAKVAQAFGEQAGRRSPAPIDAAGIFRRGRRRRHRQLATGAVSMAAVAGLVTGLLMAGPGATADHPVAQSPAPTAGQLPGNTLLDAKVAPVLSPQAAEAGMPKFYIVSAPDALTTNALQVRSSATGKVISSVAQPAGCITSTYQITTSTSERDFYVSCLTTAGAGAFYRLRVSAQGTITAFSSLPITGPPSTFVTGLAVSPDGRQLAVGLQSSKVDRVAVEVVTLATGATKTWTAPHMDRPIDLTWTNGGRELGFWSWGLRELDVTAAGSNLASARLVLSIFHAADLVQQAELSPDGTTIVAYVTYTRHVPNSKNAVIGGIVDIDARTGKPLRVLVPQYLQGNSHGWYTTPFMLGAIDPTGNHLLVASHQLGRLDRGRFTPLPGDHDQNSFVSAW